MCGIVGYIGNKNAVDVVLNGLSKLEYRGYDSAGIALVSNYSIQTRRSVGKLCNLRESIEKNTISANIAIGHTRWATHGRPSENNAHPHTDATGSIVIVHNGIIENYAELKNQLGEDSNKFKSETDTEVVAHLIKRYYNGNLLEAVREALGEVKGAYALAVLCKDDPDTIVCAKQDAPLIIGVGENENFLASDIPALLSYTKNMIFLEDGDIVKISRDKVTIYDKKGNEQAREVKNIQWDLVLAEKSGYRHFMLKEIFEQPSTIEDTLRGRIYPNEGEIHTEVNFSEENIKNITSIYVVGCGTSYHAGLVSKFLFENFAKIPTEVDIASEFRYRNSVLSENTLVIAISQSGETADTLAALKLAKCRGCQTIAVCNVVDSSISRETKHVMYTHCGIEIGVASTKAFTGQLTALYILALDFASKRDCLTKEDVKKYLKELWEVPLKIEKFLKNDQEVNKIAKLFDRKKNFLYLGRHVNYPIALEGALKLKEISYIHAEGYAAGEMKHGPIALIDETMPIVVIATNGTTYSKIVSNMQEAKARGATIIAIVSAGNKELFEKADHIVYVPQTDEFIAPLMTVIPLQLLAYYISVNLGCDVDQPRNLAKSVTVE